MSNMEGMYFADGTGPTQKRNEGDKSYNSCPPPYDYPQGSYNSHPGYGPEHCFKDQVRVRRGQALYQYAHVEGTIPMNAFIEKAPGVQNNLMEFGSALGYRYMAPEPPKKEEGCAIPGCSKDPDALSDVKMLTDTDGKEKMMCPMCAVNRLGYAKGREPWK